MRTLRTPVAIVGAGPAGLVLAHLLHLDGVRSVVLERRDRRYVEGRVRAGLLEQGTADLLRDSGVGGRMDREGQVHEGFELRFDAERHRLSTAELCGRTVTMYGQQEVVKDLIRARTEAGEPPYFGVDDIALGDLTGVAATLRCTLDGEPTVVRADFVAGCDGFHGVTRRGLPAGRPVQYERTYPFAWLGVLSAAPPAGEELIYAVHDRGFALHSMRSPTVSRLYLQVAPDEDLARWPDDRIRAELRTRLCPAGEPLHEGPLSRHGITSMRGFVVEPMQYGRLFLAGDAAHIVPPTAAKGLNLAVADAVVLARALAAWYGRGDREPLDAYTRTCLAHVWQAQEFSAWLTRLFHPHPGEDAMEARLRRARLRHLVTSRAAATDFAEHYTGRARGRVTARGGA
ncbi:4-hydroxybenzoate 3-monooxygenase [Streptomyces mobaraensis NBRC 13819 = DSM 40847]|uniref:4-hydroxybenzoate 3-monooxygenase n=1 Tax=Streptomyces mobaraensis (strain ATCC 29032 / DSM 40847 / JCM 4168 / NBRC 13819 / NCIMB 11159 / IPCR 16-22) TaxID=1223523 RepID=M3B6S4_STRM1|nr:4-hydroxybenzoate 3-monooxygenase [Streptomyces mobaraensis NBRC 13819 = DSM 40847]